VILSLLLFFRNLQAVIVGAATRALNIRARVVQLWAKRRSAYLDCKIRGLTLCRLRRGMFTPDTGESFLGVAYTGPTGSVPDSIAGLSMWYDASDAATVIGSPVSQWSDKSGNGYHMLQTNPAQRPTTGTLVHSLNSISFHGNGSSQWMSAVGVNNSPNTVFAVFVSNTGFWADWDGIFSWRSANSDKVAASGSSGGIHGVNGSSTVYTTGTATSVRVDGVAVASPANFNNYPTGQSFLSGITNTHLLTYTDDLTTSTNNFVFGADVFQAVGHRHFNGNMCEVIVYNRALSLAEIGQVETYLIFKWIFVSGGGGD